MNESILVIDDDELIREMAGSALRDSGYRVETATDGLEGLEMALASRPDLIISDVMMPRMDGWELLKELRSRRETLLIPVIFLTSLSSGKDRFYAFRLGADDFLAKPFDEHKLLGAANKALHRRLKLRSPGKKFTRGGTRKAGFSGDLEQMSMATVLTMLEMERSSGVLEFASEREGRVFLGGGRILDFELAGGQKTGGIDLVVEMIEWRQGSFEFYYQEPDREDRIGASIASLLLEAARRHDEDNRDS